MQLDGDSRLNQSELKSFRLSPRIRRRILFNFSDESLSGQPVLRVDQRYQLGKRLFEGVLRGGVGSVRRAVVGRDFGRVIEGGTTSRNEGERHNTGQLIDG